MKNVTISIDNDLHRKARVFAAERGTSLSALVKQYLETLTDAGPAKFEGVRDMQVSFTHAPAEFGAPPPVPPKDGPPWLVDGKWVYTKDGKPRKPGALRGKLTVPDDFDKWPPEMEAFFKKLQSEPWNDDVEDWMP